MELRTDKLAAVVCHDGFIGIDSGEHGFPAAGKTRKEMGFNKALSKQQVGLDCDPVDNALAAGWKRADLHHGSVVRGDMHDGYRGIREAGEKENIVRLAHP